MMTFKSLKKTLAVALATVVMSLPMATQALAAPAIMHGSGETKQVELKAHNGGHSSGHMKRSGNNHRVQRPGAYHKVRHHHPAPPPRRDRGHYHHSSTGNFVTGAIVGAIIGAVIANNNSDY